MALRGDVARPGAGRPVGLVGRLLPPAVDVGGVRAEGVVRRGVRGARARASRPTASATRSPGGRPPPASRPATRACSPARTSTRSSTAGRTTARWAWSSALAAVDALRERGFEPARPIGIGVFVEEEGSRFGRACLGSRLVTGATTWDEARELRDRDGVFLADAVAAAGLDPCGRAAVASTGVGTFVELPRRAGPRPRRPRRRRRAGQRDLAARALALRLRRPGQPRRHHPHGGPARPDADLRDDRARRQQAGPAGRSARHLRPDLGRAQRHQRRPVAGHRLARRAGLVRRRARRRWSTAIERQAHDRARPRRHRRSTSPRSRCRARSPSTPTSPPGSPASATGRSSRPRPATTPASCPTPASPPRWSSCATRPGSRTRPTSTPRPPTAWPASRRSPTCWPS